MPSFCSDSLATEHDTCTSLACKRLTNITNCLGRAWDWAWAWAEAAALELGHINYNKSYSCCALAAKTTTTASNSRFSPVQTKPSSRYRKSPEPTAAAVSNCRAIKLPLPGQQVKRPAAPGPLCIHRLRIPSSYFFFELMVGVKPRHSLKLLCRPSQRRSNSQDYQFRQNLSLLLSLSLSAVCSLENIMEISPGPKVTPHRRHK